eukprot:CAMPEP_0113900698 /NCGR_PEP_ID=MMETSP0780_2-20120614/20828_1 /TAXON_ID=652834 /ORGANISM="Palpitomonas bilix" /LENGTH=271 /DNA_ID=CAMNT_0000893199 /DNA_START=247 /DNA_END=1059 /DNA_ORIENTATION=+ /assembly_acc=CAM_ASM_000599
MAAFTLQGDGTIDNIYHFLWVSDRDEYQIEKNKDGFYIPDTVLISFRQPTYWFFSSSFERRLLKKRQDNLTFDNIMKSMSHRKKPACEILAYFVSTEPDGSTSIEYFDDVSLRDFLYNQTEKKEGILQKFVDPNEDANYLIKATWSPQLCRIEKRRNVNKLANRRIDRFSRAVTFEGAHQQSEAAAMVGNTLSSRIEEQCADIANRLAAVGKGEFRVKRMTVFFKVGADNKLWFLWCSSLRIERMGGKDGQKGDMQQQELRPGTETSIRVA